VHVAGHVLWHVSHSVVHGGGWSILLTGVHSIAGPSQSCCRKDAGTDSEQRGFAGAWPAKASE
jgi:hypothetical protein